MYNALFLQSIAISEMRIEYDDAESYHKHRENGHRNYGKFSQLTFQSFVFILTVESFLLSAERAYTVGIARLYHYDDY